MQHLNHLFLVIEDAREYSLQQKNDLRLYFKSLLHTLSAYAEFEKMVFRPRNSELYLSLISKKTISAAERFMEESSYYHSLHKRKIIEAFTKDIEEAVRHASDNVKDFLRCTAA